MKTKIVIVLLSAFFSINIAVAQPVLTGANSNPVPGEIFGVSQVSHEYQGTAGEYETWDFSGIVPTGITNYIYVSPSSTPQSGSFPTATVANSYGNSYDYYKGSSSAYSRVGFTTPTVLAPYSNPSDVLRFPFAFDSSYVDNFAVTFSNQGTTFSRAGTITVTADGHGTLIVPDGTISDVLRVHVVEDYVDNYVSGGIPGTINYVSDIYLWYKPGVHFPVLAFTELNSDISFNQYGVYHYPGTVGINDRKNTEVSMSVFPNPAAENATVSIVLQKQEQVEISLLNALGETVVAIENNLHIAGNHVFDIPLCGLANGIYFVQVKCNNSVSNKRLVVQH